MIGLAGTSEAWGLTKAMAGRAGVDLPGAVVEGWMTRRDLTRLVSACEGCGLMARCSDWLVRPATGRLPAWCRNRDEIEALA